MDEKICVGQRLVLTHALWLTVVNLPANSKHAHVLTAVRLTIARIQATSYSFSSDNAAATSPRSGLFIS